MIIQRRFRHLLLLSLLSCGFIFSVSAAQRTITVSGVVVDSASKQPVSQAMVLFYDVASLSFDTNDITKIVSDIMNSGQLDTAYTGADGKYSYSMKVAPSSLILLCGVIKQGYQPGYSMGILLSTTVKMDTVKLQKNDESAAKDTLMVTGTVVDSVSGAAIQNCRLVFNGTGGVDTAGNTTATSAGGTFSKQVIVASSATPILIFLVYKDGYMPGGGQQQYSGKQVDLGTIKIKKINTAVVPVKRPVAAGIQPTEMKIVSLGGRLLYSGAIKSLTPGLLNYHGPALFSLTADGRRLVNNVKIVLP
jgi:hypothetical protein